MDTREVGQWGYTVQVACESQVSNVGEGGGDKNLVSYVHILAFQYSGLA